MAGGGGLGAAAWAVASRSRPAAGSARHHRAARDDLPAEVAGRDRWRRRPRTRRHRTSESSGVVECETEIEQIVCGAVDDVQPYWTTQFPASFQTEYQPADTVFFTGFVDTGCGQASSEVGPFYCPLDSLVYFDLDFLVQLQERFGATGDLAAQYIVAHEYGHHVQNLLGINGQVRQAQESDPDRANEYSIALELQADCCGGVGERCLRRRPVRQSAGSRGGAERRRGSRRRPDPAADAGDASIPRAGRTARRSNAPVVPPGVRLGRSGDVQGHVRRAATSDAQPAGAAIGLGS